MTKRTVAVLMGGWSSEAGVSRISGAAAAAALESHGHTVRRIEVSRDLSALLAALEPKPDVVFNALHGQGGEDGCIQGVLDILGLPYTHSGVLASALAMDKEMTRQIVSAAGVPCPAGCVVTREEAMAGLVLEPPYVLKPVNEGSSVGVQMVRGAADLPKSPGGLPALLLAEAYVPGHELTVAVLGGEPLTVTEICPGEGFYDYANKYTDGRCVHLVPAPLPAEVFDAAMAHAVTAHKALGCKGLTRSDFRWDDSRPGTQGLFFLETNTQPGLTPLSLAPEQARAKGMEFADLVEWMLEDACPCA